MTRLDRVAELIKTEISQILRRKVNDPRIGLVSITEVKMSPDLKYAKIFVSVLNEDETIKLRALEGLNSAKSFIRGELGQALEMRVVPELTFTRDTAIERGIKIMKLINKLHTAGKPNVKSTKKSSRATKAGK
jgi:ribosome-binding factor A